MTCFFHMLYIVCSYISFVAKLIPEEKIESRASINASDDNEKSRLEESRRQRTAEIYGCDKWQEIDGRRNRPRFDAATRREKEGQ